MDHWEASLDAYQESQTLDSMTSVLVTAGKTLKEDLAPFELDWFIQTLLQQPVSLLDVISTKSRDDAWDKILNDSFLLLSTLIEKHYDSANQYINAIIMECQKPLKARTRAYALGCLSTCAERAMPRASASQHISELSLADKTTPNKGPLALLVGTICEFHPEIVADQYNNIWRTYLKLLNNVNNSDKLCKSLLKGIWCLFKNFGTDISTRELSEFYDKLSTEYFKKCENGVLEILRDYACLFKERLLVDAPLRRELWTCTAAAALLPVYRAAAAVPDTTQLQKIYNMEVLPKTRDTCAKRRCISLRIRSVFEERGVYVGAVNVDPYALEFALRKQLDHDTAEEVQWCIESQSANSVKLLQTSILFYNNIPTNKRRDIVVNGFLNLPGDDFNTTLNFLTTETCQDEASLLSFLPLWKDILDSSIIDKKSLLLEKFVDNLLLVVDNFLEDGNYDKYLPCKLSTWLSLARVLSSADTSAFARLGPRLRSLTDACGLQAPVVAAVRAFEGPIDILEMIDLFNCKDEALFCASCLALIESPRLVAPRETLTALQIIFSRRDAEPKTLSMGIKKFEQILDNGFHKNGFNNDLDEQTVCKVKKLVDNLRLRKDLIGKDARILQRDVTVFLGKYWNSNDNEDIDIEETLLIMRVKDNLTLDLPNLIDGATAKIKLGSLLQLAIVHEHEESLRMLINVLCANLCSNDSPLLQETLGRAIVAISRATVGTTRLKVARDAAAFCNVDAVKYILKQISLEKSPASRKTLCDVVECILMKEPGTASNEALVAAAFEEARALMDSGLSGFPLAGLEITDSILTALKNNSHLSENMLPEILLLITKTQQESEIVYEKASALYIENIALFSQTSIENTIDDQFKICLNTYFVTDECKKRLFKNKLKCVLGFTENITMIDGVQISKIRNVFFENHTDNYIYLWAEVPNCMELLTDETIIIDKPFVLQRVFDENDFSNVFTIEAHLRFLNQYIEQILKTNCTDTLTHISKIIKKISPAYVKIYRKLLSELMTNVKQIIQSEPNMLLQSFEVWSERIDLKNITEHLEKELFLPKHEIHVNSLLRMLEIFQLKHPSSALTTVCQYAKTWPKTIIKIYASGHFKYLKREVPYLSDLLSVSITFLTVSEVKSLILEGVGLPGENGNLGIKFCKFFMPVFVKYLVKRPFLLTENDMRDCSVLLNDVVRCSVRKNWPVDRIETLLELVNELWPVYESKASFNSKYSLLLDLSSIDSDIYKLNSSRALRFAADCVADPSGKERSIAMLPLLPGGEEYRDIYQSFASNHLPTRLSDLTAESSAALRATLDALARTRSPALLDICVTLAQGDDSYGWWDEALLSCLWSLAAAPAMSAAALLAVDWRRDRGVARRVLLPLIRHSPTAVCEEYFSCILKELLEALRGGARAAAAHAQYGAGVRRRTTVLDMLQLLFEKVPASKIESPNSSLYKNVPTDELWHVAREVIKICYKLLYKIEIPDGASAELINNCREFRYSAYKCMCVCLCVRRAHASMFVAALEARVWRELVDERVEYSLPLTSKWNQRTVSEPVSIRSDPSDRRRSRSASTSRVFRRTLSENPLEFDLVDHGVEETPEDVLLPAGEVSGHAVSGTLTALLRHLAAASGREALNALCRSLALVDRNAAWLLAQAVCSNKELYTQHAKDLRPALLAALVETKGDGLNSLHIDILNTLIYWKDDIHLEFVGASNLNAATNALIYTALDNVTRKDVFSMLHTLLGELLEVYGRWVKGNMDIEASFDDPNRTKSCIKLLLRFAKNKISVPNLLPMLLAKLESRHNVYRTEMSSLAELIGLLISNSTEQEKSTAMIKLKKILEDIKKNNISVYVKILHYSGCCDLQQFRTVVDNARKLPEMDRKRCINIISGYMSRHPDSEEVSDLPPDIREMADRISGERWLDEILKAPLSAPPCKRTRRSTSIVLDTVGSAERSVRQALAKCGSGATNKYMSSDMRTRFVEAFYISIYLPLMYDIEKPCLSVCLSYFFELLFSNLKSQQNFRSQKLRDEPLIVETPIGLSRSHSRPVGTLRTLSLSSAPATTDDDDIIGVDVQMSVVNVLDTLLAFAKVETRAGLELITQLLRCLGRGFDAREILALLISKLLRVAPQIVAVARECVDLLCEVDGFIDTVEELRSSMRGSEGEQVFRLLREEILLHHRGSGHMVLGEIIPETTLFMDEAKEFSIEDMTSAFQNLCNWDELTIQEQRKIEDTLPVMWPDTIRFKSLLDDYKDMYSWFGKSVCLYRDDRQHVVRWLRAMEKWPRRPFVISAIMEAMQWHTSDEEFDIDKLHLTSVIQKEDCLVEWSARLMLRNEYLSDKTDSDEVMKLSRSHELQFCRRANEMGLYNLALSTVDRNLLELEEDEVLKWKEQKMLAVSNKALKLKDFSACVKESDISNFVTFYGHSSIDSIIGVNVLKMNMEEEMMELTPSKINEIVTIVEENLVKKNTKQPDKIRNKTNLEKMYKTAVLYTKRSDEHAEYKLQKLCDYLNNVWSHGLDVAGVAAILLNSVAECRAIGVSTAARILSTLKPVIEDLPDCYLDQLKDKISVFPRETVRSCNIRELHGGSNLDKCKEMIQLLCDANYLLLQYCEQLRNTVADETTWNRIYNRMENRIFSNEFAGSDYKALFTYRARFNAHKTSEPSKKRELLDVIISELSAKPARSVIRLSHVCRGAFQDMHRVLRLDNGERVEKIIDELLVYTDSVRRPCLLTVLTSTGRKRRYLLKNEDLRADAAVASSWRGNYQVIPLSEDCGLIEFLEDHKRVRDLIKGTCDIEITIKRQADRDSDLIRMSENASIQNFNEICQKIPSYALRSAIEGHSASVEDFINKKKRFSESLTEVTITNWLFGLGDRHLHNLLYSAQDGGVVGVDWGAIFQHGGGEPPARLTRNMLAVCDIKVLESSLQKQLASLREAREYLLPILKLAFHYLHDKDEKLQNTTGILQGKLLAHEITIKTMEKSNITHKNKYIEMLEKVFNGYQKKDEYSVDEQISSVLLHCTHPWILSVTRSGWEPWL